MSVPDSVQNRSGVAAPGTRAGRPPGQILAYLCVAGFMVFLDVSIVNVALPTIEHSLNISESDLQYIVTTYGTVLGGFLLLSGRLADTFGRRRMLQAGLVLFALASLVAGVSQGAVMLILARGFQGLGSSFIAPAALSILTGTFAEGPARNKALGVWGAISGIASVVGVTLGGLLTEGPGWRWIFFINVPIGLIAAGLAPVFVPESRSEERRETFDTVGAVLLTAGLVLLIYTLGQTVNVGWTSTRTVASLVGAGVLLIAFIVKENRTKAPLIPFSVFKLPVLRAANIATVLMFGTLVTLFFFASLFMQQVLGYSPIRTGLAYVPLAVIVSVGAGLASGLTAKVPAKPVLLVGLTLAAVGLLLLARLPIHASYLADVLPAFLIVGLGLGMSFVPLQIAAFAGVDRAQSGLAAGLINTSQEAGGALGVAVVATIAFRRVPYLTKWAHGVPSLEQIARASVFHQAFFIGACFAVASLLVALVLMPLRMGAPPQGEAVEEPSVPAAAPAV